MASNRLICSAELCRGFIILRSIYVNLNDDSGSMIGSTCRGQLLDHVIDLGAQFAQQYIVTAKTSCCIEIVDSEVKKLKVVRSTDVRCEARGQETLRR